MPANATLYLPVPEVDLAQIFPDVVTMRDDAGGVSGFRVKLGDDVVTFNLMPKDELARHLAGFRRWVQSIDDEERRKRAASEVAGSAKTVLGLEAPIEFSENHELWAALFRIADRYDGYVLTYDSVLLPSGTVIIGALRQ